MCLGWDPGVHQEADTRWDMDEWGYTYISHLKVGGWRILEIASYLSILTCVKSNVYSLMLAYAGIINRAKLSKK